jgi:hypothetical protein
METYEYRLANRSALEWISDQYQVPTDKRSGITNDRNRVADPQYILRLIGQVITVSLETVKIMNRWKIGPAMMPPRLVVDSKLTVPLCDANSLLLEIHSPHMTSNLAFIQNFVPS